jgi:diguanylate cyclase (GGDEF)-like protein
VLRLQNIVLELVATGCSLGETADRLCREVERMLPGVVCSVLAVDRTGRLRPLAAPSLPAEYCGALDGQPVGPEVGSCGAAAYRGAPVAVTDIGGDPRWNGFAHYVLPLGLHACWSSPIRDSAGDVLGTFAFYYRECRGPTEREQKIVATCTHLCAIAMERHDRVLERERMATVDELTGLSNRASFNSALAQLPCDVPGSWAIMILDLDNLKVTNDTFGHQAGDELLQLLAARIAASVPEERTFRIGGDEFAIILRSPTELLDIAVPAQRILRALEAPGLCGGHMVSPQATMGGAILEADNHSAECG